MVPLQLKAGRDYASAQPEMQAKSQMR